MEESSSRLYSGPLSQEAQKILAVLRAQSNYPNNNRQMGRYYGSQREPWDQCSRSMSQEERKDRDTVRPESRPHVSPFSTSHHDSHDERQCSLTLARYQPSQTPDSSLSHQASSCWESSLQRQESHTEAYYQRSQTYAHRKCSEPPAYQSSRAPSLTQHQLSEMAACVSHRDRYTLSLQTPQTLSDHQHRTSAEEIRPSFILRLSPDDEDPDMVLFPTFKHPNSPQEEPALAHQSVPSFLEKSFETDNGTSGALKEKRATKSWNIPRNEPEDAVASDSRLWRRPLPAPTEEATSGGEHQRSPPSGCVTKRETSRDARSSKPMRHLDVEGEVVVVDSENLTEAGAGQMSDREHEMHNGANGKKDKETGRRGETLPGSPSEVQGFLLVETNGIASLGKNFASATSNMDKSLHCYSEGSKEMSVGYYISSPKNIPVSLERLNPRVNPCRPENPQVSGQIVSETAVKRRTEGAPVQSGPAELALRDTAADNPNRTAEERVDVREAAFEVETFERGAKADVHTGTEDKTEAEQPCCSDVQPRDGRCETDYREVTQLPGERGIESDESVKPPVDREDESPSAEDSGRERCPASTSPQECGARGSEFKVPGNHQQHDNGQTTNRSISGSSSRIALAPASTSAAGHNSSTVQDLASSDTKANKKTENRSRPTFQPQLHQPPLIPSFPLKRKHEAPQHQNDDAPPKICLTRRPLKWKPPLCCQEKAKEGGVSEWWRDRTQTPDTEPQTVAVLGMHTHQNVPSVSKQTPASVTCRPPEHKRAKCGPDPDTNGSKTSREWADTGESQSRAGRLTKTLTSDPRVKDSGKLNADEKMQMLEEAGRAETLVLTMVYQDGTTQLDPEQKLAPPVSGLLMLMKNDLNRGTPEDSLGPSDSLVYLKLARAHIWAEQRTRQSQELFTRDMLLQVLSRSQLVVCYKAKDLLRTALQFYKGDLNWKQVVGCRIQDPQVSGWLLDPADPSCSYQDLLDKHCKRPRTTSTLGTKTVSQVISGLSSLYWLNMKLSSKLQSQGLWELYSDMELNMIPVLAAMESHCIHVDKEALKRTSDLLGTKMKQLEQEAHRAAGQMFLVTSNTQLRTVLFEKLRLHERCENKKLPRTVNKQQQSTSEAALLQLQDLHPLPKIILEYRQVHKIKSTFVDGILSCMMSKDYISSTWYQTSAVTGRISAKHPNFQALPRQPLQISKKLHIPGDEEEEVEEEGQEEVVTVHPRAMFIPQKGWTFLAADFCQVELRLLAHLSSDPELLRIFTDPRADVFTMLASRWKGLSEDEVTSEDREHAKRIVYSVVYGAGRERLSGILGVSADQASQFQDSFLQTYREVQAFIQRTVQLCHKQGYVLSIMGRRRTLPNINSPDWGVRMQAERQAVNFVVQGSAADLCKMAMIRICSLVSTTSSLSARLLAQLHDELLYEVEDSQVEDFAAVVKSTMESLQHGDLLGIHLKVPLKVAVSSGKSWGSMSEINIPPVSPSPFL